VSYEETHRKHRERESRDRKFLSTQLNTQKKTREYAQNSRKFNIEKHTSLILLQKSFKQQSLNNDFRAHSRQLWLEKYHVEVQANDDHIL
jgi:hypothetical protein